MLNRLQFEHNEEFTVKLIEKIMKEIAKEKSIDYQPIKNQIEKFKSDEDIAEEINFICTSDSVNEIECLIDFECCLVETYYAEFCIELYKMVQRIINEVEG